MRILEAIKELEKGNHIKCRTFENDGYSHEIEILSISGFMSLTFTPNQILSDFWKVSFKKPHNSEIKTKMS